MAQRVGPQPADDEEASLSPGDGSVAASLARGPDQEPMEVRVPLVEVGTHLRSRQVKGPANTMVVPLSRQKMAENKIELNSSRKIPFIGYA
jgi:hypothetical protein